MGDTQSGKFVHGTGSETIAAGFVAGKGGGIDKQDVVATVGGVKRCGGTGGTSTTMRTSQAVYGAAGGGVTVFIVVYWYRLCRRLGEKWATVIP